MAELHPGPDVSLGQLEAQLRNLGLRNNQDFFYAQVGGEWTLTLSDENYQRWQEAHGDAQSEQDGDGEGAKAQARQGDTEEDASSDAKAADVDEKTDSESDTKSDTKAGQQRDTASGRHKTTRAR